MSDRTTISVRCSKGLSDSLGAAADQINTSKSALVREILIDALDGEEYEIPEHLLIEYQREQIKRENRIDDLRGGFEGRVLDQFQRRLSRGYRTDDMREIAGGYVEEARLLFDGERESEAVSYVRRLMERYEEMYDPDGDQTDPERLGEVEQEPEESEEEETEQVEQMSEDYRHALEVARNLQRRGVSESLIRSDLQPHPIGPAETDEIISTVMSERAAETQEAVSDD